MTAVTWTNLSEEVQLIRPDKVSRSLIAFASWDLHCLDNLLELMDFDLWFGCQSVPTYFLQGRNLDFRFKTYLHYQCAQIFHPDSKLNVCYYHQVHQLNLDAHRTCHSVWTPCDLDGCGLAASPADSIVAHSHKLNWDKFSNAFISLGLQCSPRHTCLQWHDTEESMVAQCHYHSSRFSPAASTVCFCFCNFLQHFAGKQDLTILRGLLQLEACLCSSCAT